MIGKFLDFFNSITHDKLVEREEEKDRRQEANSRLKNAIEFCREHGTDLNGWPAKGLLIALGNWDAVHRQPFRKLFAGNHFYSLGYEEGSLR